MALSSVEKLHALLETTLHTSISSFTAIKGGERSTAYEFKAQGKEYVVRVGRDKVSFEKDGYAFETFGSVVPVPKLISLGKYDDQWYAISPKVSGVALGQHDTLTEALALNLMRMVDTLGNLPIDQYGGYGWFDPHGAARYGNWQAWVTKPMIMVKKPGNGDMYSWKEVFSVAFVDAQFIHQILIQLNQLLKFVPPERSVIHGDFGPGNILVKDEQVTGLIDWSEAGYGDFLYDVAYFDFWHDGFNMIEFAQKYYAQTGKNVPHFFQRIDCHRLFVGLTALGVAGALGNERAYQGVVKRMMTKGLI